jgi:hypothetical protein
MTARSRLPLVTLIVALAATSAVVRAQAATPSEVDLKAAFLFNFAKFTDWHPREPSAAIRLCVVGDGRLAEALARTVRAKQIAGLPLDVASLSGRDPMDACDLVFVPASETRRATPSLQRIRSLPVLTVGDGRGFAEGDGIIGLFVEDGRLRFAVNTDAADRARLRLSSRLLNLSTIVRDGDAR